MDCFPNNPCSFRIVVASNVLGDPNLVAILKYTFPHWGGMSETLLNLSEVSAGGAIHTPSDSSFLAQMMQPEESFLRWISQSQTR